ncbi:dynein heavy chain, partial [Plakobranchus ocellatus]
KKNIGGAKGGSPELPSILQRWLVMDGNLDPSWTEDVKTLLDDERKLSLGNGEGVLLRGKYFLQTAHFGRFYEFIS